MKLRPYQEELSTKAAKILKNLKIVGLYMEVRTGKTFTALATIQKYGAKNVLFLTKKKAISSIESDYEHYKDKFNLTVINYESVHKVEGKFDTIILDESHGLGTYPKPNNKFKYIKKHYGDLPMILLSGTPSAESFSQYYHQFSVSNHCIWNKYYKNFYKWCNKFVKIKQIRTSYGFSNDYSDANYELIMKDIGKNILTFTQKEAGFNTEIQEDVLYVKMKPITYKLVKQLQKDKVIEGKDDVILADTMVKEQQKVHQLFSGTCLTENGKLLLLDDSKIKFIKNKFKGKKIGIYYNFKGEKDMIFDSYGDGITDNLEEFNNTDKNIALQFVSGREGISLKKADYLVFYNISFSAITYWQVRDRLSTIDRNFNKVYWIFAEGGLEDKIYKTVLKKKNFTNKLYKKG